MSSQGLIIKKSVPNEPLIPKQPKKTLLKSGNRKININKIPYLNKIIRKPIEITNTDGNIITKEKTERGKDGSIIKTIIEINGNQKKTTTIITKGQFTTSNTKIEYLNEDFPNKNLNNNNISIDDNFFDLNIFQNKRNKKKQTPIIRNNISNNNISNDNYINFNNNCYSNNNTINKNYSQNNSITNYSQNITNNDDLLDNNDSSENINFFSQKNNNYPSQKITYENEEEEEEEEPENNQSNKNTLNPQNNQPNQKRKIPNFQNINNIINNNFSNSSNFPNYYYTNPNYQNPKITNSNIKPNKRIKTNEINTNEKNQNYLNINPNPKNSYQNLKNITPIETEDNIYNIENPEIENYINKKPKYQNKTNSLSTFQEDALNSHNNYRQKHHSPNLILNKDLCSIAQEYAESMSQSGNFSHSGNEFRGEILGENIFYCYGTPINGFEMTDDWYSEIKYYNFNNPGFSDKSGHFTQVVWVNSKLVGFGFAQSSDGGFYAVANYFPSGNFIGDFENNVLPP